MDLLFIFNYTLLATQHLHQYSVYNDNSYDTIVVAYNNSVDFMGVNEEIITKNGIGNTLLGSSNFTAILDTDKVYGCTQSGQSCYYLSNTTVDASNYCATEENIIAYSDSHLYIIDIHSITAYDLFVYAVTCYKDGAYISTNSTAMIYSKGNLLPLENLPYSTYSVPLLLNNTLCYQYNSKDVYCLIDNMWIYTVELPAVQKVLCVGDMLIIQSDQVYVYYNNLTLHTILSAGDIFPRTANSFYIAYNLSNTISVSAVEFPTVITPIMSPIAVAPITQSPNIISTTPLSESSNLEIILPVVFGTVAIAVGILVAIVVVKRRRQRGKTFTIKGDQLKLLDQIGSGSYGDVYKARYNGSIVAAKVCKEDNSNEIDLLLQLKPHPHIVRIMGRMNGILIMEYCEGGSLDNIVHYGKGSREDKERWIREILAGIYHLHLNNIIHRDIAARNVLISGNTAKITDLGFARALKAEVGKTKGEIGPIRWMAPESIDKKIYSTQSDIWMFGMLVYEIMAGCEPWYNVDDVISLAVQIRDQGVVPDLKDIPDKYANIIRRCCVYEPGLRASIEELLEMV